MPAGKRNALRRSVLVAGALLVCLLVLLLLPPVQLQLTRAVASRLQDVELELDYVRAGPWGLAAENVAIRLPQANLRISAARADADLAFWRSLGSLALDFDTLELRGLDIDIEASAGDPLAEPQTTTQTATQTPGRPPLQVLREQLATSGIGALVRLPRRLAVRAIDGDGRIRFVAANGVELVSSLQLTGNSLAPNSSAAVRLSADVSIGREGQELAAGRLAFDAAATIDAGSMITAANLGADVEPAAGERGLRAELTAAFGGEETLHASLLGRGGSRADFTAQLTPGRLIELSWDAEFLPGVAAAFARGRSVADLSGNTNGELRADLDTGTLEAAAAAQLRGAGWDVYDPRMAALGEVTLALDLEGSYEQGVAATDRLDLAIASADRGELLRVRAEQPLRYELGEWLVDPDVWGQPALSVRVSNLPLSWLGLVTPALEFEGGVLSGAFEFVRSEERLTQLRIVEPIHASGVQLAPRSGVDFPAFEFSVEPRATLANGALEAEIDGLRVVASTGLELTFDGEAMTSPALWPQVTVEGNVVAHVPALQRVVPVLDTVSASLGGALDLDSLVFAIEQATLEAQTVNEVRAVAAELAAMTPLRLRLLGFAADWSAFEPRTATLRLDRAPIDWVSDFVPELEFRGGEVSGLLTASGAFGSGLTLEAPEALRIEGIRPVYRGIDAAGDWTASVKPRIHLQTSATSVVLEELSVTTQPGNSLQASVTLESTQAGAVTTSIDLVADIGEYAGRGGLHIAEVHWRQRATLEPADRHYTVEEFFLDVTDPAGAAIVTLEALETFEFFVAPFSVAAESAPRDIIRATVSPIRLEQVLPNLFDLELQGVLPEGEFFGRAEPDGALVFVAAEPLVFRDVSVRWGEATLLDRVTTSVEYEVSYSGDGVQARTVELAASGADGRTLFTSSSRVTAPMSAARLFDRGAFEFEAYLEPLAQQPVLDDLPPLSAGTLSGSFGFVDADELSVDLSLRLRNAEAVEIGRLADVDLELEAVGVRGERMNLTLPLHLESPEFGVSDLRLEGAVVRSADGILDLEAALEGQRLSADDLRRFAAYALAIGDSDEPEEPDAPDVSDGFAPLSEETLSAIARLRTERDRVPVWTDRLNARTRVSLDEIAFSGFAVQGVRGRLELTPAAATLTDVQASLLGADLLAAARVDFDAEQAAPYSLEFRADVEDLALEDVFLALSPEEPPVAEGQFELTSTLTSRGRNPLDVALASQGRLHLTGGDGVFRGLSAHAGTGSVAARAIGILTFSRELRAVGRMLDGLGEIRFDDAEFLLERSSMDRIDVRSLALRSPQLRLGVTGSLELARLRPLLLSPLDADLLVGAAGDAAILFDGMGLLEDAPDADGYRAFTRPVHVGGMPAEPDMTEFWELLEEAAENSRGVLGIGLRALNRRLEEREE